MRALQNITFQPSNMEEMKALKAIGKAFKMKFTLSENTDVKLNSEQKKAIDQGLQQIEEGKVISHDQAMTEIKNRHPKYFK